MGSFFIAPHKYERTDANPFLRRTVPLTTRTNDGQRVSSYIDTKSIIKKETYMTNNIPDVLTAKDLQAYLHISRAGAYNLLSRADFPTLYIGKRKLVTLRDLQEWIAKNTGESTL
jgi:hypothetical protein